jgi:hypothetical protein
LKTLVDAALDAVGSAMTRATVAVANPDGLAASSRVHGATSWSATLAYEDLLLSRRGSIPEMFVAPGGKASRIMFNFIPDGELDLKIRRQRSLCPTAFDMWFESIHSALPIECSA